jgi:hypothetical protein
MTEQIQEHELIAAEHGLYFPSSLGARMLETELAMTYEQDLTAAQADFERIISIPLAERSAEDCQRYVDVSLILSGDL